MASRNPWWAGTPAATKWKLAAGLTVLAAQGLAGCGYHFASSGSGLPSAAHSIYVEPFENRSRVTGIQDELAIAIKDEIAKHKRLDLVDSEARADLTLKGRIRAVDEVPAAFNTVEEPLLYNIVVSVDADLIDRHTGKPVWSARGLTSQRQYASVAQAVVPRSIQFVQQNLRAADIGRLPDEQLAATQESTTRGQTFAGLARDLYAVMSEGF